jgi:hypothetical protein
LTRIKKGGTLKQLILGASNGDNPAYFNLFKAAMEQIGIKNCRMIPSKPDKVDFDFLNLSNLILLADGNVKKGLSIFQQNNCR